MSQIDHQRTAESDPTRAEARLTRHGGITYLFLPAVDAHLSASFYEQVFGWTIHGRERDHLSFDDATGNVSGAWATDLAIAREPGLLPYIYVDQIEDALARVQKQGGEVVKAPYREGTLWIATFRDPAGNVLGLWQEGLAELSDPGPGRHSTLERGA